MAYTKTPMESTEQNKRIPLFAAWETRTSDNAKDVDNLNVVLEKVQSSATGEDYFEVIKRDGLSIAGFATGNIEVIFGAYSWVSLDRYVRVTATTIQMFNTTGGLIANTPATFIDAHIGFTEFQYENGTSVLIITDGVNLYSVTSGGVATAIVDPDRPVNHLPYPVFLDGYLFLADLKGNICNSDLNDPTSWVASNFLAVESYPDPIYAMARVGQYIVTLGATSIQYFYDAANPTGTPLAAQTTVLRIGFVGGLVEYKDGLIFLGKALGDTTTVFMLEGLRAEALPDAPLKRRLVSTFYSPTASIAGVLLNFNGRTVYSWYSPTASAGPTYGLDLSNKVWSRLAFQLTANFSCRTSVVVSTPTGDKNLLTFYGGVLTYVVDPTVGQDAGFNYEAMFQSPLLDFGTRRMKFGSRLIVLMDQPVDILGNVIFISWTDDDYQTFSVPREVAQTDYMVLWALGAFRARAWKLSCIGIGPCRWTSMELDYNQGSA